MGTEPPFTTTCQSNTFSGTRCANCRTKQWVWETACTLGSADGCLDCLFSDRLYSCDIGENHTHFLYRLSKVVKNRESWKNSGIMHKFIFFKCFLWVKMVIQTSDPNDHRSCHTSYYFIIFRVFFLLYNMYMSVLHACMHVYILRACPMNVEVRF